MVVSRLISPIGLPVTFKWADQNFESIHMYIMCIWTYYLFLTEKNDLFDPLDDLE